MEEKSLKTTTQKALVAVSETESGLDYVQVMPENPCVGLVKPFRGMGYGAMLSNGSFDFVRRKRIRHKPEKKTRYGSLTFGQDGFDRYFFVVPSEQRQEFAGLLVEDAKEMADHMKGLMKGGKVNG